MDRYENWAVRGPSHSAVAGVDDQLHSARPASGFFSTLWTSVSAAVGVLMGLVPHVLHHVGLLAGTALVTGTGGNLLFGLVGLLFSLPLFRRLYRRFHTWKAPAMAFAVFVTMFALSAWVIGPAISGSSTSETPAPDNPSPTDHGAHHNG